ncbi:MAG: universal stress protein [Armatimonadota bacterium]
MRVLVTTDGSESSYQAVRQFIELTRATYHEIKILYVMPLLAVGRDAGYFEMEQQREGRTALDTVKSQFTQVGIAVETELRQGIPANTILEIARSGNYDLIVMGHRGRGGFREILLGSVSKTIVHNAPCSVFIGR